MGRLAEKLGGYSLIGLDTSVFIYHLETYPDFAPLTQEIFSGVEQGNWSAVTSTITLMEINVHPFQLNRPDIARKYEALLVNFPNLSIVYIDREIARRAAQLRAEFRIRPADALQVAASLVHKAGVFITNDQQLERLKPLIEVVILKDYALGMEK
jgi:predicted nucleic acid-binding protein